MSNFGRAHLEKRYQDDTTFQAITNSIYKMIAQFGVTPSEIREAMFLAHYRYEMENPCVIESMVQVRMGEIYDYKDIRGRK